MMNFNKNNVVPLSMVLTVFNDSESIIPFLENIEGQTLVPSEVLIVDGGSTDKTSELISNYRSDSRLNIVLVSDGLRRNISQGLNDGIKRASELFILIVGTGNLYESDFISEMWKAKTRSECQIFYSSVLGLEGSKFASTFNQYFLNGNRCVDWEPSNHGVLIAKNVFETYGLFWERFFYAGEDSEFFNRVIFSGESCEYVATAILHWETPINWQEFNKKMKVNAIADLQIHPLKSIVQRSLWPFVGVFGVFLLSSFYLLFLCAPFFLVVTLMIKKKTFNVVAILLGLSSKFILPFHYFSQRKFGLKRYKVTNSEKLRL